MFPETFPEPPIDISHPHKPRIISIIANSPPLSYQTYPQRPIPPHTARKLCHGPHHRKTTRVQTMHQSHGPYIALNLATLQCQRIRQLTHSRGWWTDRRDRYDKIPPLP